MYHASVLPLQRYLSAGRVDRGQSSAWSGPHCVLQLKYWSKRGPVLTSLHEHWRC